jgi:helix-turn-helix protein
MSKKKKIDISEQEAKDFVESLKLKSDVDWQKLCERLQEALAKEMKENEFLSKEIEKALALALKKQGAVEYLESKIADYFEVGDGD